MIKHVDKRIIVKVDLNQKNAYTFSDGTEIILERNTDNFDRLYVSQVLGVVIDGKDIPQDALILFHHNSTHETYQVHNHSALSGEEIKEGIKVFSIMERDCFFWKKADDSEWKPTKDFATALRVFEPYTGVLENIEPTRLKDTLWVTSGEYKDLCCLTVDAADYQITFRDPQTGVDKQIIRFRPNGDDDGREPEIIAIMNDLTERVKNGKLLVGLTKSDCKPINS